MAAKAKRNKIPKRIGGVKVPKSVRRGARRFLATQTGRTVAAEALVAIGAAMAGKKMVDRQGAEAGSGAQPFRDAASAFKDAAGGVKSSGSAVSFALAAAARTFADALHQGKARADAKAAWSEAEEEPSPPDRPAGRGRKDPIQPH